MLFSSISRIFSKNHKVKLQVTKTIKLKIIKNSKKIVLPEVETNMRIHDSSISFNFSFSSLGKKFEEDIKILKELKKTGIKNVSVENESQISFSYLINEENSKPVDSKDLSNLDCDLAVYQIKISVEDKNLNVFSLVPAICEAENIFTVSSYEFDYGKNVFGGKKTDEIKYYTLRDFRDNFKDNFKEKEKFIGKTEASKFLFKLLPETTNSNFLQLKNSIEKISGATQFFQDRQAKSFVFINEGDESKITTTNKFGLSTRKIVFAEYIDFLEFLNMYIDSMGDGFLPGVESEENEESSDIKSEDYEYVEEVDFSKYYSDNHRNNFKTNLSGNNRFINANERNLFISDGKSIAAFENYDLKTSTVLKNIGQDIKLIKNIENDRLAILDGDIKFFDLEKQQLTDKIKSKKEVLDLFGNLKLSGVNEDCIFELDERSNQIVPIKEYKTKVDFKKGSSNVSDKMYAIGSSNGDIRIYKELGKRATCHIRGYGDLCRGIAIYDEVIAATYKNYVILIFGTVNPKTGKKMFTISNINTKKLTLTLEHTLKVVDVDFTPAVFSEDGNKILTSVSEYIISWDIKDYIKEPEKNKDVVSELKTKKGNKNEGYYVSKYDDNVVSECIRKDKVYVLMDNKIQVDDINNYKKFSN